MFQRLVPKTNVDLNFKNCESENVLVTDSSVPATVVVAVTSLPRTKSRFWANSNLIRIVWKFHEFEVNCMDIVRFGRFEAKYFYFFVNTARRRYIDWATTRDLEELVRGFCHL